MMKSWQENVSLKQYCSMGVGGPSRYFVEVKTIDELCSTIRRCAQENQRYFVLGKGSNCLFDDRGFDGLVILNKIQFFQQPNPGEFYVGAGFSFALLGVRSAKDKWSGLEFASGIPGSVGGAVYMNAGANGQETCDCLLSVDYVDEDGKLLT